MAKLTAAKRDKIPKSAFAIPSKRAFPLENISHARNALSRVVQNGTPAEIAAVRKAVAKKFPSIAQPKAPAAKRSK